MLVIKPRTVGAAKLPVSSDNCAVKTFPRLKFDLHVILKLEGCVLTIQEAKIKEMLPGTCQGLATLEWNGFILAEAKTGKMDLGDKIRLGKGVEISAV